MNRFLATLLFSTLLLTPTLLSADRYEVRLLVKQDRRDLYYSQGIAGSEGTVVLPIVLPANGQCKVILSLPPDAIPPENDATAPDCAFSLYSIVPLTDGASQYREVLLATTSFRYRKGVDVVALETAEYSIVVELKRLEND